MDQNGKAAAKSRWQDGLALALMVSFSVFVTAWAGIEITRGTGRIAAIWLANAVLLAALLKRARREWALLVSLGYGANVLANVCTGDGFVSATLLSSCNSVEVLIAGFLVTSLTKVRDFRRPKPMIILGLVSVGPASMVAAALGAFMVQALYGADFGTTFFTWYAADALGLLTLTPILLVVGWIDIADLAHPAIRGRAVGVALVLVGTLSAIFLQSSMPLLFLAFPAIVVATFSLGFVGASLAVLLTSSVALWATVNGMGPISLMQSGFRFQIITLQIFTAITGLTAVSIAALMNERDLLSAALSQAPDFQFIKNLRSEFVSVNAAVARNAGFLKPKDLVGKTDFDLAGAERAEILRTEEIAVMQDLTPIANKLERLIDPSGSERWFETSKSALTGRTGRVIGLAGTTRDVTERKVLEAALEQSSNRLSLVLSEMSDGVAVVSADGHLVLCNEQYKNFFPLTGRLRVPGAFLPAVLVAARDSGEQPSLDPTRAMQTIKAGGDEEVMLSDGRWLQVRSRPKSIGGAIMIVSDITASKRGEIELRALSQELEALASTDGLTGLANRRTLDDRLEKEIARCKRSRLPISLIMIDIDKFKAFNDLYGHPTGDECLRRVTTALRAGAKRPGDLVARYGGEEFAILLPETDEAGAFVLAEQLRLAVRSLNLEHLGSEKRIVTVSLGVASLVHDGKADTASELIIRADEALYIAKGAGRDRVMGWSARNGNRFASAS